MKTLVMMAVAAVVGSLVVPVATQAATEEVTVLGVGENALEAQGGTGEIRFVPAPKKPWLIRGLAKGDRITVTYEQDGEKKVLTDTRGSGTVVGTVVRVEDNHITVEAENGAIHRLTPGWVGGMPKDGGGYDIAVLAQFHALKAGQRVQLKWAIEEGKHATSVTVLPAAKE